jgi:pteridine reductase
MAPESTAALFGKAALVTGAARRVGAEIVRTLHGSGAAVIVHYRSSEGAARELVAELNAVRSGSAVALAADLRDVARIRELARAAHAAFGRLDILVNNASTFYPTPLGEIAEASFEDLVGSNLKAPLFLAQALAAALRDSHGLIVNLADIHGLRPLRRYAVYSTAKAGLIMLTRALARELAPEVRVNAVAPGPVLWDEAAAEPELQQKILERTPLRRPGSPGDVARAVRFFAAEAPYVTGQILAVDGGRSIGW